MAEHPLYLGFDIGGTEIRTALGHGTTIAASRAATWPAERAPADEVQFVADLALALMRDTGLAEQVRAVGVALAALTDREGTVVDWPNRPSWRGLRFRPLLAERLALPTIVEDDANAAALAEWGLGAGRGFRHVAVITVGTGIGAGLILDGALVHGRHGWAGELGHLVMQPDGPLCACGHRGCLQLLASGRALERVAAARGLDGSRAVTAAAALGQEWAVAALVESARWLGLAAANVVNLLDLEAVVIGGGLSALDDPWWGALQTTFEANLLTPDHRQVALLRTTLPQGAGVLGALWLAQQLDQEHSSRQEVRR